VKKKFITGFREFLQVFIMRQKKNVESLRTSDLALFFQKVIFLKKSKDVCKRRKIAFKVEFGLSQRFPLNFNVSRNKKRLRNTVQKNR
jgi:hypothetical protein